MESIYYFIYTQNTEHHQLYYPYIIFSGQLLWLQSEECIRAKSVALCLTLSHLMISALKLHNIGIIKLMMFSILSVNKIIGL